MVKLTQIQSIKDVKTFVTELVQEGTNFHPDQDDFKEYVNLLTGERIYTDKEILLRNTLLKQCLAVVGKKIFLYMIPVLRYTSEKWVCRS